MRRVEFLGCEGIGKTTLFNELFKQKKTNDTWITLDEARTNLAYRYAKKNRKISNNFFFATILLCLPFQKTITTAISDLVLNDLEQDLIEKNEAYHPFFRNIIDLCYTTHSNPQIRLQQVSKLYKKFCRILFLENNQPSDIFLLEEGTILGYALYLSNLQDDDYQRKVISFFHTVSPPAGIIHCILDQEETMKRIIIRSKNGLITIAHRDSINRQILVSHSKLQKIIQIQNKITEIGVNIMKSKNVKILTIDMVKSTTDNIIEIKKFLKEFE